MKYELIKGRSKMLWNKAQTWSSNKCYEIRWYQTMNKPFYAMNAFENQREQAIHVMKFEQAIHAWNQAYDIEECTNHSKQRMLLNDKVNAFKAMLALKYEPHTIRNAHKSV